MKSEEIKNKEKLSLPNSIYNKNNFKEFCRLKTDWNIKSVDKNDLPEDISEETCEFINIIRRKTANETTEWNFYIDYENNEIIHCLHGGETNVKNSIHSALMQNRKILSIHNHPPGTYSAPSATNFEILEHEFEDYEIICAEEEYWILEAKGYYQNREKIQQEILKIFNSINKSNELNKNKQYSYNLTKFINKLNQNIKLTKKEYR